ncbi:MAG: amino acid deaminase/aldolase [Microscillaceae bacterium]|jgi:D-serine deaminase-like pyridoxal phosphate-dependent protein|nr:amino acid deaminase/aldolase [Microscillaceae bacterium]
MTLKTYEQYREIFKFIEKPFAFVDLDYFDANVQSIKNRAGSKKIRIATKSLRCTHLLQRILNQDAQYQGLMTYCAPETVYLSRWGFDNLLLGYPVYDPSQIEDLVKEIQKGKKITLMVDSEAHIRQIASIAEAYQVVVSVCLDVDMSSDFWGGIHFGVYRSSVKTPEQALKVWEIIKQQPSIRLSGIMGYEAQIAGLGAKKPTLMNQLIRFLKKRSIQELAKRRAAVVAAITSQNPDLEFVNGGGTGSLESTILEKVVSEVTVGSGFYSSGLFDNYLEFKHLPAVAYAIEIVRQPQTNIYTCAGGGYVASGAVGKEKLPSPYLPWGCALIANEGVGEVQTPIVYQGSSELQLGDPIFLRHAKAGEIGERFTHFYTVEGERITGKIPTYRGEGQCFI